MGAAIIDWNVAAEWEQLVALGFDPPVIGSTHYLGHSLDDAGQVSLAGVL